MIESTDFSALTSRANIEAFKERLTLAAQTDQHFFEQYKAFAHDESRHDDGITQHDERKNLEREKQILRDKLEKTIDLCARMIKKDEERTFKDIRMRHDLRAFRNTLQNTVNYVAVLFDLNHVLRYFDTMVMRWCLDISV